MTHYSIRNYTLNTLEVIVVQGKNLTTIEIFKHDNASMGNRIGEGQVCFKIENGGRLYIVGKNNETDD